MLPIRHQVQVICELDSFRQLLQDIDAESFAALLYVSSLISFVAVNREETINIPAGKKQRQHNSKIQHTVKQHFATLVSDHVFSESREKLPTGCFYSCVVFAVPANHNTEIMLPHMTSFYSRIQPHALHCSIKTFSLLLLISLLGLD